MDDESYRTRLAQMRPDVIDSNYAKMQKFGPFWLVKVVTLQPAPPKMALLGGYFTMMGEIARQTPDQMRLHLGLRDVDLAGGAAVYQMLSLPERNDFLPRGYSSLIDGLPGTGDDPWGYRKGRMAWQAVLRKDVAMQLVAAVAPGEIFVPPVHPRTLAMYGRTAR